MEELKEVPLYTVLKDKNGYENKICNFDNDKIVPKTGIIQIEALKRNQLKQPNTTFKKYQIGRAHV